MAKYRNMMEDIMEMEFDALKGNFQHCPCEQCRNDIIAYALNHVNPRYVVSTNTAVMVKLESCRQQDLADIRGALTRGFILVGEKPRHG